MEELIKNLGETNIIFASIITSGLTLLTTIVGFIINYIFIIKQFQYEVKKKKSDLILNKMSNAISYIIEIRASSLLFANKEISDKEKEKIKYKCSKIIPLYNKLIYGFGSNDAIEILESINKENIKNANNTNDNPYRILCLYQLLIIQIRYEVTDVIISPITWFSTNIEKFEEEKENFINETNNIIDELNLNQKFKITN